MRAAQRTAERKSPAIITKKAQCSPRTLQDFKISRFQDFKISRRPNAHLERWRIRVRDSGFRIRVRDSGFRIQDSGLGIQDSGFRIQDGI